MTTKRVLILFDKIGKHGLSRENRKQFSELYSTAQKHGLEFCRAPIDSYIPKKHLFEKAQFFKRGKWFWKKNVIPDIVYDKTPLLTNPRRHALRQKIEKNYTFINSLKLSALFSNKWETYKKFRSFSPKTILISSKSDLNSIKFLKSELIVLKPLVGSGGKGIKILPKEKIKPLKYPFIAQELIRAEKGIEGLVRGPHDLRVFLVNNEKPFYSYIRTPKKGGLMANYSFGGSLFPIPVSRIPKSVIKITEAISKKMSQKEKKLFCIDFIIDDNQKPWILEMNSRPGITAYDEEEPYKEFFYTYITNFFLKIP